MTHPRETVAEAFAANAKLKEALPGAKVVLVAELTRDAFGELLVDRYEVRDQRGDVLAVGLTQKEAVARAIFLWGPK